MPAKQDVLDYQTRQARGLRRRHVAIAIITLPALLLTALSLFLDPGTVVLTRLFEWDRHHEQRRRAEWLLVAALVWLTLSSAAAVRRWRRPAGRAIR